MGAGLIAFYTNSYVPDLLVGIFIAYINIDAAKKVWTAVKWCYYIKYEKVSIGILVLLPGAL